jgi:FAS-associated factor 2
LSVITVYISLFVVEYRRISFVLIGNVGVSELLTSLIQAVDVFTEQQRMEIREEDERAARELVKREQDAAYQESLEADR